MRRRRSSFVPWWPWPRNVTPWRPRRRLDTSRRKVATTPSSPGDQHRDVGQQTPEDAGDGSGNGDVPPHRR